MEPLVSRDEAWRRLKPVLAQFSTQPLFESSRILQDLDIGGDDADELLETVYQAFGARFDGFTFSAFFPNEDEIGGERWLRRLGFRDTRKVLTVGHLLDVIQRGSWFEPPVQTGFMPTGNRARRLAVRALVTVLLPLGYVLAAVGAGQAFKFSLMTSLLLFGLPAGAVLAMLVWRQLPEN